MKKRGQGGTGYTDVYGDSSFSYAGSGLAGATSAGSDWAGDVNLSQIGSGNEYFDYEKDYTASSSGWSVSSGSGGAWGSGWTSASYAGSPLTSGSASGFGYYGGPDSQSGSNNTSYSFSTTATYNLSPSPSGGGAGGGGGDWAETGSKTLTGSGTASDAFSGSGVSVGTSNSSSYNYTEYESLDANGTWLATSGTGTLSASAALLSLVPWDDEAPTTTTASDSYTQSFHYLPDANWETSGDATGVMSTGTFPPDYNSATPPTSADLQTTSIVTLAGSPGTVDSVFGMVLDAAAAPETVIATGNPIGATVAYAAYEMKGADPIFGKNNVSPVLPIGFSQIIVNYGLSGVGMGNPNAGDVTTSTPSAALSVALASAPSGVGSPSKDSLLVPEKASNTSSDPVQQVLQSLFDGQKNAEFAASASRVNIVWPSFVDQPGQFWAGDSQTGSIWDVWRGFAANVGTNFLSALAAHEKEFEAAQSAVDKANSDKALYDAFMAVRYAWLKVYVQTGEKNKDLEKYSDDAYDAAKDIQAVGANDLTASLLYSNLLLLRSYQAPVEQAQREANVRHMYEAQVILSQEPDSNGIGQPGFADGLLPLYGAGRSLIDHAQNKHYGLATLDAVFLGLDLSLVGGVAKTGGKALGEGFLSLLGREALEADLRSSSERLANLVANDALHAGESSVPKEVLEEALAASEKAAQLVKEAKAAETLPETLELLRQASASSEKAAELLKAADLAAKAGLSPETVKGLRAIADRQLALAKEAAQAASGIRSFTSFDALKRALGPAGPGQVWHHIVEQRAGNVAKFGPRAIHNTENVVRISREANQALANYYASVRSFTNRMTVREWLATQSFSEQDSFGRRLLDLVLRGQPLPQ